MNLNYYTLNLIHILLNHNYFMPKTKPTLNQTDINLLKQVFTTKEESKDFVTKKDLANFATKDDLKNLVTKDDLDQKLKKFATKKYLDQRLEKFVTKDYLDQKFEEKLKPIIKVLKQIKDSQNMIIDVFDRQIIHHDKRLNRVENHLKLPPLPKTV